MYVLVCDKGITSFDLRSYIYSKSGRGVISTFSECDLADGAYTTITVYLLLAAENVGNELGHEVVCIPARPPHPVSWHIELLCGIKNPHRCPYLNCTARWMLQTAAQCSQDNVVNDYTNTFFVPRLWMAFIHMCTSVCVSVASWHQIVPNIVRLLFL